MKLKTFKYIVPAVAALVLSFGLTSCNNTLDLEIEDPQTNTTYDPQAMLVKIYSTLHLTGTTGPDGSADMAGFDEGNSGFYRRIFEANELCSDECIWTWQGDAGIPELTNLSWNSSHGYNELTYYRLAYNNNLINFYLDQTAEDNDAQTLQNRAEVRFLRALYMSYQIDLFGKVPFKEHYDADAPVQLSRADAFEYVVKELKAINGDTEGATEVLLDNANSNANYGRADKVAANMLLARLYLNAEVYTGKAQWQEAVNYANKVIGSSYSLNKTEKNGYSAYEQLFMGDNGENTNARQEIIFPIRCDVNSRSWSGSIYPIASTTGDGTPTQGLAAAQWTCNRAREAMVAKFFSDFNNVPMVNDPHEVAKAAKDDRALFFSGAADDGSKQRTISTEEKTTFAAGLGIMKWSNIHAADGSFTDASWPDTDIPLLRVAEAYLTLAEANYRMGGENSITLNAINELRNRAHTEPLTEVKERDIIDEWCREFYFEGRRRSDLIRFGLFTSGSYLWDWKGGSYTGNGVSSIYNLYPIPARALNNNVKQNPGY
ncbi:MAG: RagB/SusD family nutrient uptake outer membrane protein [Bacteroidaceae bacterium]|nr:RagB/SusD family nutrient uptake outer membrane protein [Bacteroidaceae bacterium]